MNGTKPKWLLGKLGRTVLKADTILFFFNLIKETVERRKRTGERRRDLIDLGRDSIEKNYLKPKLQPFLPAARRSTCGSFFLKINLLTNVPKVAKTTLQTTENRLT